MAKRKALDFTADYEIHVLQSSANRGKFWSQIVHGESLKPALAWEQADLSESARIPTPLPPIRCWHGRRLNWSGWKNKTNTTRLSCLPPKENACAHNL